MIFDQTLNSVVSLERAGPGVGGGVVLPLSVPVSLALELLFSNVLVRVLVHGFLLDRSSLGGGNGEGGEDERVFHFL